MKRSFRLRRGLILLAATLAPHVGAQTYVLADGRRVPAEIATVAGGQIKWTLSRRGDEAVETAVPLGALTRLEWPMPKELVTAAAAFTAGDFDEAQTLAEQVMARFTDLRGVDGAWWIDAAGLRVRVLHARGEARLARAAADELIRDFPKHREARRAALVRVELDLREGALQSASRRLSEFDASPVPDDLAPERALVLGAWELARKQPDLALEAFLEVTLFHRRRDDLQPQALLGVARAYRALQDEGRLERTVLLLRDRYPNATATREAAALLDSD